MSDIEFRGWQRRSVALDGLAPGAHGRLQGTLELTAQVAGQADVVEEVPVALYGPGDVAGLARGAVLRTNPPDGAQNVDGEYCAFVEFHSPDLPWRYSPQAPSGDAAKPWLALVAGAEGSELGLDPDGTLWMRAAVTSDLPPRAAACWAHTHTVAGGQVFSRVLCPRELPPDANCLAALVPVWKEDGSPRWSAGTAARGLPVLLSFRFRTNADGTFEDLVTALVPTQRPADLGRLEVATPSGESVLTNGILAPRLAQAETWPAEVLDAVRGALEPEPPAGVDDAPPVVGPPVYSRPWPEAAGPWSDEVDAHPQRRAAAGLGARAGVDWQHEIAAAAAERLGATHHAAALLRDLATGVGLALELTSHLPSDDAGELAFYGPALPNLPSGTGTALDRIAEGSPVGGGLFSAAAAHLLRPGGTVAKASGDPAAVGGLGAVLAAALGDCPEPERAPLEVGELRGDHFERSLYELLFAEERRHDPRPDGPPETRTDRGDYDLDGLTGYEPPREEEPPPCTPLGPEAISTIVGALGSHLRPDHLPVERVLGRLKPRPADFRKPLEVAPDLDLPAWKWVEERAPHWLLPAAELIPANGVLAMRTDRAAVAAFLVGLSHQALGELRWRGVPVSAGAMPMRTFWQRVAPAVETGDPLVDLVQPSAWPAGAGLAQLPGPGDVTEELVIVIRSDLVRRYPDTLVYLTPDTGDREEDLQHPIAPSFVGRIGADVWFFGFPVKPAKLAEHLVVFEEPNRGPRFAVPRAATSAGYSVRRVRYETVDGATTRVEDPPVEVKDGGHFAWATFTPPVRAICQGSELLEGGE